MVLDEVHLTYNSQRGLQVSILLRRLEKLVGRHVQVAGLSASIADPSDIWVFFRPGERGYDYSGPGEQGDRPIHTTVG